MSKDVGINSYEIEAWITRWKTEVTALDQKGTE